MSAFKHSGQQRSPAAVAGSQAMEQARQVEGGAEQTTVEQALMRGLDTAGPLVRLGAASVLSRALVGTGHKMAARVPLRAPPPASRACGVFDGSCCSLLLWGDRGCGRVTLPA